MFLKNKTEQKRKVFGAIRARARGWQVNGAQVVRKWCVIFNEGVDVGVIVDARLSHWDLADDFSAGEISSLMLGKEPSTNLIDAQTIANPIYKTIIQKTQEAIDDLSYHANHFYKVNVVNTKNLSAFTTRDSLLRQMINQNEVFEVVRQHPHMANDYMKGRLDAMFTRFERTDKFMFSKFILEVWNSLRNTLSIKDCFSATWVEHDIFSVNREKLKPRDNLYIAEDCDGFRGNTRYFEFMGFEFIKVGGGSLSSIAMFNRFSRDVVAGWIEKNKLQSAYNFDLEGKLKHNNQAKLLVEESQNEPTGAHLAVIGVMLKMLISGKDNNGENTIKANNNQEAIALAIETFEKDYKNRTGLSKKTAETIFAEANKYLVDKAK